MALIVQKYGGTSVGSVERIRNVARRVAKWKAAGHEVVVVPSAMAGETNRLIALAKEIQAQPDPRELDVIATTGEQVTIGLLAMALMEQGVKARSYTGWQVKVLTDSAFTTARIVTIDEANLRKDLEDGYVAVVAGFQGMDDKGNITTLGRGGSDTSAVALAAANALAGPVDHAAARFDQGTFADLAAAAHGLRVTPAAGPLEATVRAAVTALSTCGLLAEPVDVADALRALPGLDRG